MRVTRDIHNQRLADFLQTADEETLSAAMEAVDRWADVEAEVYEAILAPLKEADARGESKWLELDEFFAAVKEDRGRIEAELAQSTKMA
jgi:hypothetical protein